MVKLTIVESVADKDLYDDLYSYADEYRMTSRWTKDNVEKYLKRQKDFRRMSDADFDKVVAKVNKDFKRKKKVKSDPYSETSYKTESKRSCVQNRLSEGYDDKERYKIAENIASWAFGSPNMNDIDDNIDFIVNRFLKRSSLVDRIYMCDTYEELADVLSECSLKLLMSIERGLCIDEDSVSCETDYIRKMYGESYGSLNEEDAQIEVKHEGILEVPEGKNVDDLPFSHFEKLANKKGLSKITKALNNLQVWNKKKDPKLSKWAGNMIDRLNKKLKKDESFVNENSLGGRDYSYISPVLQEFIDFLEEDGIPVLKVNTKFKHIDVRQEDLEMASWYLRDRDYFGKEPDLADWAVASQA